MKGAGECRVLYEVVVDEQLSCQIAGRVEEERVSKLARREESGARFGYVAGGGPGFVGGMDTTGA
jgi:hypothetical protein